MADNNNWDLDSLDPQIPQWDLGVLDESIGPEPPAGYVPVEKEKPKLSAGRLAARLGYTVRAGAANLAASIRSTTEAPPRRRVGSLYQDMPVDEKNLQETQAINPFARYDVSPERRTFLSMTEVQQAQVMADVSRRVDDGFDSDAAFKDAIIDNQKAQTSEAMYAIEQVTALPEEFQVSSGLIEDVVGGIGTTITSLPAYAAGPLVGLFSTYHQIKGAKVQELEKLGAAPADVDRASTFAAVTQSPLEAIVDIKALSTIFKPRGSWVKTLTDIALTSGGEAITEFVQTYPDEYATMMALNPNVDGLGLLDRFVERLPETTEAAAYSALVGAISSGTTVSLGVGARNAVNALITPEQRSVEETEVYKIQETVQKIQDGKATDEDVAYLVAISGVEVTLDMSIDEILAEAGDFADIIAPIESPARTNILQGISGTLDEDQASIVTTVYDQMARAHASANGVATSDFYELFSFEKAEIAPAQVQGPVSPDQYAEVTEETVKGWEEDGYVLPEGVNPEDLLFQDGPKDVPSGKPKGAVSGAFKESSKKIIVAFQGADVSTMVHEISHIKLSLLAQENRDDFLAIAKWAGVHGNTAASLDITKWSREQLEQVAVGFEEYMREGRAPTAKLQPVFSRIREWMIKIYGSLRRTQLEMSDEVRAIFDSWLAAGQERISEASNEVDEWLRVADLTQRKFNPKTATYDDATWEARRRILSGVKERREAQDPELRKRIKQQAKEDVDAKPEYLLIDKIRKVGLDIEIMKESLSPELLSEIRRRVPTSIREKGADPTELQAEFGFSGLDMMAAQIIASKPKKVAVAQRIGQLQAGYRATLKSENTKLYRDIIVEELKILEEITGEKAGEVSEQDIEDAVDTRDDIELISDIRRDNTLVKAAMAAGKATEALQIKALQKERISRIYEKQNERAKRGKIDRRMSKYWKNKSIPEDYRAQIARFLSEFYEVPEGHRGEPDQGLTEFLIDKASLGNGTAASAILPDLYAVPVQRRGKGGRRIPMNLEEKERIARIADQLIHMARTEKQLLRAKEKIDFETDLAAKVNQGYATFGMTPPDVTLEAVIRQPVEAVKAVTDSMTQAARDFNAWLRRTEFDLELLDGEIGGPNAEMFRTIVQAEREELVLAEQFSDKFARIMAPYAPTWAKQKFKVPGSELTWTKEQLFMIALNNGNEGNRGALLGPNNPLLTPRQRQNLLNKRLVGTNLTEIQIDHIVDNMLSDQERESVEQIWGLFDELYPMLNEVHKTLNGVKLEKVKGRYFPLVFDKLLSAKSQEFETLDKIADPAMNTYYKTSVYAKNRVERIGGIQPVNLSLGVVTRTISDSIHDITHQIPVRNAFRTTEDGRYQQMYIDTLGEARYRQLQSWLKYVARPVKQLDTGVERALTYLRHNATVVGLGLKLTTAAKQVLSYAQVIDELNKLGHDGTHESLLALQKFYAEPAKGAAFANESSIFMKNRVKAYDRDAGEMLANNSENPFTGPARKQMFRMFLSLVTMGDKAAVYPTWTAGYTVGLREHNNDHTKAVEFADRLVRVTQPSNSPKDLSAIQRGREWERMISMFQGFFNMYYQRAGDTIARYRLGKLNLFEVFKSFWWTTIFPASIPALVGGLTAVPRGGELPEPGELAKDVLKDIVIFPTASVPFLRDIVNSAAGGRRFALTPVESAGEAVASTLGLLGDTLDPDEDVDLDRARKIGVNLAGYLFGIPSAQLNTSIDGFLKLQAGETKSPLALLFREPKREKKKISFR